jgi:hypothetical protein
MSAKHLLTTSLLLFVAAAIVVVIVREAGTGGGTVESTDNSIAVEAIDGLVAYYFHGETRCPTCRTIEAYAHEAIEQRFAAELASGAVVWRVVNYESPGNKHFVDEYEIFSPTVVIVRLEQGRQAEFRNLVRGWELVGDRVEFIEYVQQQVAQMLAATSGEPSLSR